MNESFGGFGNFLFDGAQAASLRAEFDLLITDTDLSRCDRVARVIVDYKAIPGIYFWVMRLADEEYKIYIGKTNSMSYRTQNYVGEFQPHSPNDFKMRIFRGFMAEIAPLAALDLYFCKHDVSNITQAENLAVAKYNPLLNRRLRPSIEARLALRDAFSSYYRSSFEQALREST